MSHFRAIPTAFLLTACFSMACAQPLGGDLDAGGAPGDGAGGGFFSTGGYHGLGTGGAGTGGVATGGTSTGGAATGGTSTGGAATGGASTGGTSSGGASTGGASSGGTSSGGASSGGSGGAGCTTVNPGGESADFGSTNPCFTITVTGTWNKWAVRRNAGRTLTINGNPYTIAASGGDVQYDPIGGAGTYTFQFSGPTDGGTEQTTRFAWW